jgi:hypothetical protein
MWLGGGRIFALFGKMNGAVSTEWLWCFGRRFHLLLGSLILWTDAGNGREFSPWCDARVIFGFNIGPRELLDGVFSYLTSRFWSGGYGK